MLIVFIIQLADKMRQAFGKEKFYDGDNPLADDNPAADSSDIDDYSSEEDAMTYQVSIELQIRGSISHN